MELLRKLLSSSSSSSSSSIGWIIGSTKKVSSKFVFRELNYAGYIEFYIYVCRELNFTVS